MPAMTYRYGRGPIRAMLLHGWFGDVHDFDAMLTAVDPDMFTFAGLVYRGYGSLKDQSGPYDIGTIASDALELADSLSWERFSVVGHSMGGKVALRLAIDVPERIERLCGVAPVWAGRSRFDEKTMALFRSAKDDLNARRAILANSTGFRLPPFWAKRMADRSFSISNPDAFASYFESWALEDFAYEAANMSKPTLVLIGMHDRSISEIAVRATWLKYLTSSELVVFPECGHYPAVECPLVLAARITEFLGSGLGS